ncbi:Acetolactate synthase large subunit [Streptomyces sp. RB5]|uniref:Acetolactate synthase large subunit n=1 Tax=Streptomyces smaragdinus TaxID=2585196 RepID=A0A7K0CCW9_9ACTN|nr:thiamine pyrophosphate-binding protein [Streptomyces smaragdinus]MQY11301.1 Acetolactate synthase large subunit [Streptomyces smaragdinus]
MTEEKTADETVTGAWRAVVRVLEEHGVRDAFGLPADDLDLLEALHGSRIRLVLGRDQRNAVFMATGYALQSGRPGIAFTGKGPAVTNAVTGLLEAAYSAAPVVLISAGTAVDRRGAAAFQELDQLAVVRPLTKWAARVDDPARLAPMLERALLTAADGVPGPVYLEVPDQLLTAKIPLPAPGAVPAEGPVRPAAVRLPDDSAALRTLGAARRPVLLVGGGTRHIRRGLLERYADHIGAAVFATATGRGAFDETHPRFCGLSGLYLPEAARELWDRTDCVIAFGSRLEETATYTWPGRIGHDVPVVQVNVDAGEFHTDYAGPRILADAGALLAGLAGHAPPRDADPGWSESVTAVHDQVLGDHEDTLRELAARPALHIPEVLAALRDVLPEDLVLVQENGLQDMWSYSYPVHLCPAAGGSVVPSEQTSLGFGAAAAAGVQTAAPGRPVVALVGDGAFNLFASDLPTLAEHGLGVLYVVLRNNGYGWLQHQLDDRAKPLPGFRFADPDGAALPLREAPGVRHLTLDDKTTLRADLERAWKLCREGEPVVLDVPVRLEDSLFGKAPAGGDFPLLSPTGAPAPDTTEGTP